MAGKVEWHGDKIQARIRSETQKRIKAACRLVLNHWVKLIKVEGTTRARGRLRLKREDGTIRVLRKGRLVYGGAPSAPGEPPHVQTGHLWHSAAYELLQTLIGRVGTNTKYLLWLELGTKRMKARPSLRRALQECLPQVRAILTAPLKL